MGQEQEGMENGEKQVTAELTTADKQEPNTNREEIDARWKWRRGRGGELDVGGERNPWKEGSMEYK